MMTSQKVINAPRVGAQINDQECESLICNESENDTFLFPWSKKFRLDFLRPYQDPGLCRSFHHLTLLALSETITIKYSQARNISIVYQPRGLGKGW